MTDSTQILKKADEILEAVLEAPTEHRQAALARLCEGEDELREHVELLLGFETLAESIARATSPKDLVGETFGPYKLIKELGRGGMAWVYLARRTVPYRRDVALKVSRPTLDSGTLETRFERERALLGKLEHPGIATIFDAGATETGFHYFVMEHLTGGTLTEYCDRLTLDLRARLDLFVKVCDAVHYAHQNTIIHRDLKPGNILVGEGSDDPMPKVIDFGLGKELLTTPETPTAMTETGQILGTVLYMSPEQAGSSDELELDIRTDVYSLGVVLYELLTGALQHSPSGSVYEHIRKLQETDPRPPIVAVRELGDDAKTVARKRGLEQKGLIRALRGDLTRILLKSLERDRNHRYASADALATDLRRHLADEPISIRSSHERLYVLRKFVRRHRRRVALASGAVALVVLVSVIWVAGRLQQSSTLLSKGTELLERYRTTRDRVSELGTSLDALRARTRGWIPLWERGEEVEIAARLEETAAAAPALLSDALIRGHGARLAAPSYLGQHDRATGFLRQVYTIQRRDAQQGVLAGPAPDYFDDVIQLLGGAEADTEKNRRETIVLRSDPPRASVYCFRHVGFEMLELPVPYHPDLGPMPPARGLVVRTVADRRKADLPFKAGDRLLTVVAGEGSDAKHHHLTWIGDLAEHLAPDVTSVRGTLERQGEILSFEWETPMRPLTVAMRPDETSDTVVKRLVHAFLQCGIAFEGMPLSCSERNLVGTTRSDQALRIDLEPGSYLFLIRLPGHEEVRYPVAIPLEEQSADVTLALPAEDSLPEGFVHVPGGHVATGGDLEAFQSLDWGHERVGSFVMSKLEVTFGQWLEFLNDEEVASTIDEKGKLDGEIVLVPWTGGRFLLERGSEGWSIPGKSPWRTDWPVFGISHHAAEAYARWRSSQDGRWRFRLPTGVEWERAARGVDRRAFTWGNSMVWSNCWSARGSITRWPDAVGISPFDESPFGILDMNGSVSEFTSERPLAYAPDRVAYRGGNWDAVDENEYFRLASRNTILPDAPHETIGIRLVAELK